MNSITAGKNHWAEIRRTLALAMPVILGQLAGFGMNFVDTVMAGQLGATALAAIAVGGSVWSALLLFVLGILMALTPAVSQLDGAQKQAEAGAVTRQAAWVTMLLGGLMFIGLRHSDWVLSGLDVNPEIVPLALGYLDALSWAGPGVCLAILLRFFSEGTSNTKPTMYIGFLGVFLNIPLNYILMFGKFGAPQLGAVGCGYATSIVAWVQALFLLVYIKRHDHYRPFALFARWEKPVYAEIKELLRVGLPISGTLLMEGGLFIGASLLIARLDETLLAAHQVAINFASLTFMIPLGLSFAITVRVGNAVGRGDARAARYVGVIGMVIALAFQLFSALLMFIFPEKIIGMYTSETGLVALAVQLLFLAAIFQLSDGLQVCAAGGLRGMKDTKMPLLYSFIAYWVIGMTLGYYLTFPVGLGPSGMWIGMIAGLTAAAVMLTIRFWRSSGKLIRAELEQSPD